MQSFKQQCIKLREKDYTLNEIVEATGRSKTSVYFHIKNIGLSEEKKSVIVANSRKRALQNAVARRGKSKRAFIPCTAWNSQLVLLFAHLLFDGEIRRVTCGYSNRSVALIRRVKRLFQKIYQFPPSKYLNEKTGVYSIRYHNVALAAYADQKARQMLDGIGHFPVAYQKEFLRAFFDDEGCMDFNKKLNKRRIRGYQNDRAVLALVQKLLRNIHVESRLQGKNEVVITGKENLKKFQREINFSKGVRLNPNRTNSIWKKDIEKRELLDMAIKSFKK